jgi:hypothetical protein
MGGIRRRVGRGGKRRSAKRSPKWRWGRCEGASSFPESWASKTAGAFAIAKPVGDTFTAARYFDKVGSLIPIGVYINGSAISRPWHACTALPKIRRGVSAEGNREIYAS